MPTNDDEGDELDQQVRDYGRRLPRPDAPLITADDLRQRGFMPMGGPGLLLCRWAARLRLDALPDLAGSYTRLHIYGGPGLNVRFRFASLAEWDVWLAAFDREYPRH
jgi:hypothetical protein